uniref:Uncharacterized protein n=1 Tax=Dunaliella tertiolecta TaxID=3047 RepID=A0A7S3QU82_DUNTE
MLGMDRCKKRKMVRSVSSHAGELSTFVDMAPLCTQGAVLATSERGGMRIQFSKNPYGRRTPHVADPMPAMPPTPMGPFYSSPSWAAAPIMPPHHMPHMPPY